jgi:hypothetical protein
MDAPSPPLGFLALFLVAGLIAFASDYWLLSILRGAMT